jgi:hypothetical protein
MQRAPVGRISPRRRTASQPLFGARGSISNSRANPIWRHVDAPDCNNRARRGQCGSAGLAGASRGPWPDGQRGVRAVASQGDRCYSVLRLCGRAGRTRGPLRGHSRATVKASVRVFSAHAFGACADTGPMHSCASPDRRVRTKIGHRRVHAGARHKRNETCTNFVQRRGNK